MILKKLNLVNFKNYTHAELDFDDRINVFTGLNGQGKTNLLDAIYYLSYCKSYFNPIDAQNILHDEAFFVLDGIFEKDEKTDRIYCGVKKGQKKSFKRNKNEYDRLSDHIGLYPVVIISPYDKDLISEGSEIRRKFMDSIISQYNRPYLDNLIQYHKVLQQRNTLLKQFWESNLFEPESLEIWDVKLVQLAEKIFSEREKFISNFNPVFQENYEKISGAAERVSLEYKSHLSGGNFGNKLEESLRKDRKKQYTNVGVHKDDLVFKIGEYPLKKFGSQGQQKSFLIALKLAQFEIIKKIKDVLPILLLDDVFDKIDELRAMHLMQLVSDNHFGQLFITDTHEERVPEILQGINSSLKLFSIHKGEAHEKGKE